jgi:hypothetical protein
MLDNDPELVRLFCIIKTEMYWFCKCQSSSMIRQAQLILISQMGGEIAYFQKMACSRHLSWRTRTSFSSHTRRKRRGRACCEEPNEKMLYCHQSWRWKPRSSRNSTNFFTDPRDLDDGIFKPPRFISRY